MNSEGSGRDMIATIFQNFIRGTEEKIAETFNQDSRCPSHDFNQIFPKYKSSPVC
jgi:hypothetical protein